MEKLFWAIRMIFFKIRRLICLFLHPILWHKKVHLQGIVTLSGPYNLQLGEDVVMNDKVHIMCSGGVTLGKGVILSRETKIITQQYDTTHWLETCAEKHKVHIPQAVSIGDYTWICSNVVILPGAQIADRCIVGAGSVVTKSLTETGCLYGGVPAKKIKKLN